MIVKQLNFILMHVFGVGCACNKENYKLLNAYNVTLALILFSISVRVYLEKKFLYTGFSIFATCLHFVQYYLVVTHVIYTILHTTFVREKYGAISMHIETLGLFVVTFYSAVALSALFVEEQFVSWSCWTSVYLTTVTSALYINYLVSLLKYCSKQLKALCKHFEDLVSIPCTLTKITKCLSSSAQAESESLPKAFVQHKALCDLSENILQKSVVSVALLLLSGCFSYSVLLYKIAMYFISSIQIRRSQWFTWYMIDSQTVVLSIEIYTLIRSCEGVTTDANRIAIVLHKVRNVHPNFGGADFNAHSMRLLNQKLRLSLSGVFVLDVDLLVGILVFFGTLVVISLQCDEDFLVTNPKTVLLMSSSNETSV
ncbi:hypothetical protein FQR65_LT14022 [Abscondita terminalis]|nr:hypothetical protein FQR65_LT14022 [Abscondita terminalis]